MFKNCIDEKYVFVNTRIYPEPSEMLVLRGT
jgi:hypothetical protein